MPSEVREAYDQLPEQITFNEHIRPILSDRCWSCHGPDANARQADLRLDTEAGAFASLNSGAGKAFISGSLNRSVAWDRMLETDPELQMPPPESNLSLSPQEVALIAKWIEQGAEWQEHWAFLPVAAPEVPDNPAGYPAENSIDHFINESLQQRALAAAPRADPERLLRRLYLDLTGLAPTPQQADAWLANPTEAHYRQLVDSLLQTTTHAERLTMDWLDLARYADSHGLHADGARTSWPWRDWVIEAFYTNQSFDQFVSDQLAGDLYPEANSRHLMATAFGRMHPMTAEGGVISEEFRLSYVFDRVNTVATGLLGLTMDCSRCHDHKFDPLSQEEYYSFSAFFNNVNELGMTGDDGDFGPYMLLPDPHTQSLIENYDAQLNETFNAQAAVQINPEELAAFIERQTISPPRPNTRLDFDNGRRLNDESWKFPGGATATKDLEVVEDEERGKVIEFDYAYDDCYLAEGVGNIDSHEPLSVSVWFKTVQRDSLLTQTLLGSSTTKNQAWKGLDLYLDEENYLNVRFIRSLPDDLIHLRSKDSVQTQRWYQAGFTYDGTARAAGTALYLNGQMLEVDVLIDNLRGSIYPVNNEEWRNLDAFKIRLGQAYRAFTGENGIFFGRLDDLRLFNRSLSPAEMLLVYDPAAEPKQEQLATHFRQQNLDFRRSSARAREIQRERLAVMDTLPRLMIMEEMPQARATFVLDRGAYDAPQQQVFPATPRQILPFPTDLPPNRIGLAKWLFLPENPLTARVTVNRYWQLIFGRGIVATPHDFGSQGSLPTHPRLLDHLATEFRESDWDLRALLRKLVLSDTYRRSSEFSKELVIADPENIYLARGQARRLPAEMIRDNALFAAGLLRTDPAGPSVKPYQPAGLWFQSNYFSKELLHYVPDQGQDLYRRSMYTFIRRTAPPPFMTNFDATGRDVCLIERAETNTPLQALNLLNDPQFVEAARVLAQRVQQETSETDQQIQLAFRLVTGRRARPAEVQILQELYQDELQRFGDDQAAALALLEVGEYPAAADLDPVTTAALASVSNTLLSFDEAYTKR